MSITIGPFAFATTHLIFIFAAVSALLVAWLLARRTELRVKRLCIQHSGGRTYRCSRELHYSLF